MAKNSKIKQKQYDDKRKGMRTRNWTCVCYPDDLPCDWQSKLSECHCQWACSPLHDMDFNADGNPKKPHYHIVVCFDTVKTLEQFCAMLKSLYGESGNSIVGVAEPRKLESVSGMIRYFAHLDNPDKAQYNIDDIVGYNGFDVCAHLKKSMRETAHLMQAVEDLIDDNNITEFCDLVRCIRNLGDVDMYLLVTTKSTYYYTHYITSRRNKLYGGFRNE